MSAGQPNWQKLMEMRKLPKEARGKIPALAQLDAAKAKIEQFKSECCDDCRERFFKGEKIEVGTAVVEAKCEVDGCDFVAKGKSEAVAKNIVRLHSRTHAPKDNKDETKE